MVSTRLSLSSLSSLPTRTLAAALLVMIAAGSAGRLLAADGDLDLSFGGGLGYRYVAFDLGGGLNDHCSGIAAAADGTLFAVGFSDSQTGDLDWTVAKITEGVAPLKRQLYFDLGATRDDSAQAVALDRSGRLLVAGNAANSDRIELRVCRLLPATLSNDPDFNSGSCVAIDGGAQSVFQVRAVVEAPDSGVLVAGTVGVDHSSVLDFDWFVLKLDASGVVDISFGLFGIRTVPWNLVSLGYDYLSGMAVDAFDGSIALVGTPQGTQPVGALARLTAAGNLDLSFGQQGRTSWALQFNGTTYSTLSTALLRDPIGNGYLVGGYMEAQPNIDNYLFLSRFDAAGGLLGSSLSSWGNTLDFSRGLLLQSDRKLVLTGDSASGSIFRASRFVFQQGGALVADVTYGTSGDAMIDPNGLTGNFGGGVCAATLDAGRVVLLAGVLRPDRDWMVIRLQNSSIFVDGFEPGNSLQWSAVQP